MRWDDYYDDKNFELDGRGLFQYSIPLFGLTG
jgi:hypothetical protein